MPDDPKPTPIDWPKYLGPVLITAGLVFVGWRAVPVNPTPGPAPAPTPAPVIETKFSYERTSVLVDGIALQPEEAKPIIDAANVGSKTYLVRYTPFGKPEETRTVTVSGGVVPPKPVPPAPPIPPKPNPVIPLPTGFAGEVAVKAQGLPAKDCLALAENYQSVASMIAAGGILKLEDAIAEITRLNKALALDKPTWTPFAVWLATQFDAKAQGLPQARETMEQVVRGLEYAGGAK
jgi:hypothetical protein